MDKLNAHAAIAQLVDGAVEEDLLHSVISFAHGFKPGFSRSVETTTTVRHYRAKEGGEQILVNEETETKKKIYGQKKNQVGYFRVFKDRRNVIGIIVGSGDDEREFMLGYDMVTLAPRYFGEVRNETLFRFGKTTFYRQYIEVIYGERPGWFRLYQKVCI